MKMILSCLQKQRVQFDPMRYCDILQGIMGRPEHLLCDTEGVFISNTQPFSSPMDYA